MAPASHEPDTACAPLGPAATRVSEKEPVAVLAPVLSTNLLLSVLPSAETLYVTLMTGLPALVFVTCTEVGLRILTLTVS